LNNVNVNDSAIDFITSDYLCNKIILTIYQGLIIYFYVYVEENHFHFEIGALIG